MTASNWPSLPTNNDIEVIILSSKTSLMFSSELSCVCHVESFNNGDFQDRLYKK